MIARTTEDRRQVLNASVYIKREREREDRRPSRVQTTRRDARQSRNGSRNISPSSIYLSGKFFSNITFDK